MRVRTLWLLLLLSVAVNLGFLGSATYHWHRERKQQCSADSAASERAPYEGLQLTAEQRRQMDRLRADLHERMETFGTEMRRLRNAFLKLLNSPEPDPQAINQKLSEMGHIQSQIQRVVAEHLLAEKRLLSADQQSKYLEMLKRRFQREDHHGTAAIAPLSLPVSRGRHRRESER